MKNLIKLIICFFITNSYSQSRGSDIYFLIDKNDTLIKKQLATKKNPYEGYQIYSTKKKTVIMNNTPVVKGKIWGEDSRYDYKVLKRVYASFSFYRRNDTIITKEYMKTLDIIRNRDDFLNLRDIFTYYFIESTKDDNKYIMRKVFRITYQ